MEHTVKCKLVAKQSDTYSKYVFQLDNSTDYILCTRLPNWEGSDLKIGDSGFLTYDIVRAGEEYYDVNSKCYKQYLYDKIYFKSFINLNKKQNIIIV